jgi:hypothetical protein|tara:strand:+ start:582 stop:1340 length:759 start_codon:yes stop_codon:yes gene_type:complete
MISYIIPTLWKSDNIHKLISSFNLITDPKAELIIIDNTNSPFTYPNDDRVKIYKMEQNLFVNPSWQMGYHYSNNDRVCIINDDIIFNVERFHNFVLKNDIQAVCMTNWNKINEDNSIWKPVIIDSPNARPAGAGQLMMVKTSNWPPLPYELKLWHGDDIIYYYNTLVKNTKFTYIEGMSVTGDQSVTVNSDVIPLKMKGTFTQDTLEYYKIMRILGLECSTVFPMGLKIAWKNDDDTMKLEYEKRLNKIING